MCATFLLQRKKLEENLIFFLAGLSRDNYEKLTQIFSLYEAGQLSRLAKSKKGLFSGGVDCAPSNFKGLRNLSDDTISVVLDKVISKDLEIKKLNIACKVVKETKKMKIEFARETGVKDWAEAQQAFPYHATDDRLEQYAGRAFTSKGVASAEFIGFCRKAVSSKQQGVVDNNPAMSTITYKSSYRCVLFDVKNPNYLSLSSIPGFGGFRIVCASATATPLEVRLNLLLNVTATLYC